VQEGGDRVDARGTGAGPVAWTARRVGEQGHHAGEVVGDEGVGEAPGKVVLEDLSDGQDYAGVRVQDPFAFLTNDDDTSCGTVMLYHMKEALRWPSRQAKPASDCSR
jgi:hypothetical protein